PHRWAACRTAGTHQRVARALADRRSSPPVCESCLVPLKSPRPSSALYLQSADDAGASSPSPASGAVSFPASTGGTHMSSIPAASELAASSASEDGIPPPIYLGRVLWLCFFPVFTVVVGDFVLIFVAQAREALVAFNDRHAHSQLIAFAF